MIPKGFKLFKAKLMAVEFYISKPDDLMQVSSYIHDLFDKSDKPLKVEVKSASNRSLSQNSTYWMWLGELSHQIKLKSSESYSTDDLHEYMKARFCPDKILKFGNKEITVKSTTKLEPGEMHFYMNQVHEWAVNAGFNLTMPIKSEYREIMERQSQ